MFVIYYNYLRMLINFEDEIAYNLYFEEHFDESVEKCYLEY